jgi:hypothetical protein
MSTEVDPDVKAYLDSALQPSLERFAAEMAKKRAGGFDDDDIEDFVIDAVEGFEEHVGEPLDPIYGPYVIGKLRGAAGLSIDKDS